MTAFLLDPLLVGLIGFAGSWAGVTAVFVPARFVGIRPVFGWQGIIPARARTIAPRLVNGVLTRVGSIRDVYEAADPERITDHLICSLRPRLPEIMEDVFLDTDPELWDDLSEELKQEIINRSGMRLSGVVTGLLAEIDQRLEDLFDIDWLTQVYLIDDRPMLVRLIRSVGRREITVLRRSGLFIGIVAGLLTGVEYPIDPDWLVQGLICAVVFGAGSALVIQILFGWPEPRQFGPFLLQGWLYQNQDTGVAVATRIVTRDIITVRNLVHVLLTGRRSVQVRAIIRAHTAPLVEDALVPADAVLSAKRTPAQLAELRLQLTDAVIEIALDPLNDPTFNSERQVALEDVFVHRMLDLSATQWRELVLPAFSGVDRLAAPVAAICGFGVGIAGWLAGGLY